MKKLFMRLIPVLFLVSLVRPCPVQAAELWDYTELQDGSISITCTDTSLTRAEIPEEIDGHPVRELGEQCFSDCTALTEVVIPEGVTVIRSYAFTNCKSLTEVGIPASVAQISDFCFEGCASLKAITVAEGNTSYRSTDGVLFTADSGTLLRYPAAKEDKSYQVPDTCKTLSPWSFTDCNYLQEIGMQHVNAIGADAFMNCAQLRKAVLSEGLTELIGGSFAKCPALVSAELPDSLLTIGDRCFFGDTALSELTLPKHLTGIGEMAFYGCVSLTTITIPATVGQIGDCGLGYSVTEDGENAVIPELHVNVTIGSYGYRYARENGLKFKAELPPGTGAMIAVGVLLAIMLIAGIVITVRQKKLDARLEQERLAEEERQKRLAERKASRKKKGKK